jgi:hypothetical protein
LREYVVTLLPLESTESLSWGSSAALGEDQLDHGGENDGCRE